MSKTLTFLFFSAIISSTAIAQVSFPLIKTTWTQRHGQGEAPPKFTVIGVKSDNVVIGGKIYHKVYQSETDVTLGISAYVGAIREDAMTRRVYYYDLAKGTERMVYDFSLNVGDTVFTAPGNAEAIVYATDIVNIAGVDRKRITFRLPAASTPWMEGEWVEGIGNTGVGGLTGSPMAQPTCDCATTTVCFAGDGVIMYHNANYLTVDCENVFSTAAAGSLSSVHDNVKFVPNPASGFARMLLPAGKFETLTIADVAGRIVRKAHVAGQTESMVDTRDMAPGVYFYRLDGGKEIAETGKFSVM